MPHPSPPPERIAEAAGWMASASSVVALTGAGVSTGSGIPDYRGPQGLWTREPDAARLSSIQVYLVDAAARREVWRRRLALGMLDASPNAAHAALVALERAGHLDTLITQNIDGLHQLAGSDPARVMEVHGTGREVTCLDCGARGPMGPVLERVRAGDLDPHCEMCGGLLKAATISFGQALDPEVLERAGRAAASCEVFLAVGTSLAVQPVAMLPAAALAADARLVIVNAEPTPYDDADDAVFRADAAEVLDALVDALADHRGDGHHGDGHR
jgi:NAD-dependent deacetylase